MNDEAVLQAALDRIFRTARVHMPTRAVHRWRGRRFVTRMKVVVGGWPELDAHARHELAVSNTAMFKIHCGDFGVSVTPISQSAYTL